MKILFIGRIDYPKKAGGDGVQMEAYKAVLKSLGHEVTIATTVDNADCYDIVHFFNIDRIRELVEQYRRKVKNEPVLILHSIYQKKENKKLAKSEALKYQSHFNKIGNIDFIKYLFRSITSRQFSRFSLIYLFSNTESMVKSFIKRINYFHFLSDVERCWFEQDFGISLDSNKIIYFGNGINKIPCNTKSFQDRSIDVLIPSRIEPHKNLLPLISVLRNYKKLKIIICGQMNNYYKRYAQSFLSAIKNTEMDYIGAVDRSTLDQLYQDSKIIVSLSLSEVAPLIELEALSNRCIFIGTSKSASENNEKQSEYLIYCEPLNIDQFNKTMEEVLNIKNNITCEPPSVQTWEDAMKPLLRLYNLIRGEVNSICT